MDLSGHWIKTIRIAFQTCCMELGSQLQQLVWHYTSQAASHMPTANKLQPPNTSEALQTSVKMNATLHIAADFGASNSCGIFTLQYIQSDLIALFVALILFLPLVLSSVNSP